jgi:hypothetical protein
MIGKGMLIFVKAKLPTSVTMRRSEVSHTAHGASPANESREDIGRLYELALRADLTHISVLDRTIAPSDKTTLLA